MLLIVHPDNKEKGTKPISGKKFPIKKIRKVCRGSKVVPPDRGMVSQQTPKHYNYRELDEMRGGLILTHPGKLKFYSSAYAYSRLQ